MATITFAASGKKITDPVQIHDYLAPLGIYFENWPVAGRVEADATNEEILSAYHEEIERLKVRGGYVTADVINVTPATPNLDAMLAKFDKEHTHDEDEVRFTVAGRGVFWVQLATGEVISIEVVAGDLINVPAGVKHWFHLCDDRTIRCIRLFQDPGGWTPHYCDSQVHNQHAPLCWGPSYLPGGTARPTAVKL